MNAITKLFVSEIGKQAAKVDMYYIAKECLDYVQHNKKWSNVYNYHTIGMMRTFIEQARVSLEDNFMLLNITHNLNQKEAIEQLRNVYSKIVSHLSTIFAYGKFDMEINYIGFAKEDLDEDNLMDYKEGMFD